MNNGNFVNDGDFPDFEQESLDDDLEANAKRVARRWLAGEELTMVEWDIIRDHATSMGDDLYFSALDEAYADLDDNDLPEDDIPF